MEAIDALLASPLPVIVSLVVALMCVIGIYVFVLPMMEENRKLRQSVTDHQEAIQDSLKNLSPMLEDIAHVKKMLENEGGLKSLFTEHQQHITKISQQLAAVQEDESSEEVMKTLQNIESRLIHLSEKQTHLSGMIQGINMMRDNPPRGV